MYSIRIFDSNLNFLGEIDDYISFIFKRSFYSVGTFEILINFNSNNSYLLDINNYIAIGSDLSKSGIIKFKKLNLDRNGKSNEEVLVKGFTLDYLFNQRVILPPAGQVHDSINSNTESVIHHYINNHIINATDTDRNVSFLELATNQNRGITIDWESRYKNLLEELNDIRYQSKVGISSKILNNKIIYDIFESEDKTISSGNPVLFSTEYDNIERQDYTQDNSNFKNVGYVGGQGVGIARNIVEIGNETGINRHEMFIDKRNTDVANLSTQGQIKLNQFPIFSFLDTEILKSNTFQYEIDWDLGDKVTIVNKKWGLQQDSIITVITEVYQNNKLDLFVEFDDSTPTLTSKIKQMFVNNEGVNQ